MTAILCNYKGFVENTNLTENQQVLKDEHKILFGCDENGKCWYKIRKSLKDGTAKVVYENDGSIRHIDFGPGDTVATPLGGNIVELDALPEGVAEEMHFWKFDGEEFVPHTENRILFNKFRQGKAISKLTEQIALLDSVFELKMQEKGDEEALLKLKKKRILVSRMDLTKTIDWNEI